MATPVPTTLAEILPVIQTRLVDVLRLGEECVLVVDPDEIEIDPNQADRVVAIWIEGETPLDDFKGKGRYDTREKCRLSVTVLTRLATDEPQSGFRWITDAALGHWRTRHGVLDALLAYQPLDKDDNWLIEEPLAPAPLSKPRRERKTAGWGESRLGFELVYTLRLSLDYL